MGGAGPSSNGVRLHSAIGYVTPLAKLEGREEQFFKDRDRKPEAARQKRKAKCNHLLMGFFVDPEITAIAY